MIYRVIQECVLNVLKHANASRLDVSMIAEQNEGRCDDRRQRKGFDVKGTGCQAQYRNEKYPVKE